jgi:hypothetical protein
MSQDNKENISLLTLLAYDATKESNSLLKKHGIKPARNYKELEFKLAKLYEAKTKEGGALKLEQEMAEIHPHKKWVIERTKKEALIVEPKQSEIKQEIKEEKAIPIVVESKPEVSNDIQLESFKEELKQVLKEELANNQTKSNADGECPSTCPCKNRNRFSMIEGDNSDSAPYKQRSPESPYGYIGMVAVFGLVGIVLITAIKMVKE